MNYAALARTALRLLKKDGLAGCTLVRPGSAAPANPLTPWKPDFTSDATVASGLHVVKGPVDFSYEDGGPRAMDLTPAATATLIVSPLELGNVFPMLGDFVTFGSHRYSVLHVLAVEPGGIPIIYTLHAESA